MDAPVHAGQQDAIHHPAQRGNIIHDLNLETVFEFSGKPLQPAGAEVHVGAAALVGGYDARAAYVVGVAGIVEELGISNDVRGIEPDETQAQIRRRDRYQHGNDEDERRPEPHGISFPMQASFRLAGWRDRSGPTCRRQEGPGNTHSRCLVSRPFRTTRLKSTALPPSDTRNFTVIVGTHGALSAARLTDPQFEGRRVQGDPRGPGGSALQLGPGCPTGLKADSGYDNPLDIAIVPRSY